MLYLLGNIIKSLNIVGYLTYQIIHSREMIIIEVIVIAWFEAPKIVGEKFCDRVKQQLFWCEEVN